jgi:hypothetical protein
MTEESSGAADQRSKRVPVSALVISGVVLAGAAGFWVLDQQSKNIPAPKVVLTPEAKAYVKYLQLGDVTMKATDAFLKQTLVEIEGKITNFGDRKLVSVEINCVFYDPYGQVVLRERVPIVRARGGGLNPGETKNFRLAFDTIPESWNQALPQLVIAQIIFG